jgi:hypothetical protein
MLAAASGRPYASSMHHDPVKLAIAEFLRHVSHTAQRELEKHVRNALQSGRLKKAEDLPAAISLHSDKIGLDITIHSRIEL